MATSHRSTPKLLSRPLNSRPIMTDNGRSRPLANKSPPLTHFLCLPLVNSASISQLEKSIAEFKELHQSSHGPPEVNGQISTARLGLPSTAFRPLGTLHLTLGVMSLTKERLEEASAFLQSLDLESLMHEAQKKATSSHRQSQAHSLHISQTSTSNTPFSISLESLHALPRNDSATILHASPVDPTGRLYPFCVMLRDKFIEAGFILNEGGKKDKKPLSQNPKINSTQSAHAILSPLNASSHRQVSSKNLDPYTIAITREPKPRPLLLHATLVNTIYVKGRKQNQDNQQNGKSSSKRMTFDARNLVSQSLDNQSLAVATSPKPASHRSYIWARDFPINSICICEMGAKKLHPDADKRGLNERLGEQYLAVAQRTLSPSERSSRHPR
ncbi:unnamed protein product [Penicillium salamii]|uniref:A-kinase anchor protein 7-like phosphoesterase domain-containing protein n=1 Tax=Penicillium salamii TaxID=1612424 RepID=A0A9W4NU01_9EURO|nr:unnamed protein product [Penicillium salamii]CAG8048857.1 unnamed protein product [Penicillium salamii]CAG8121022.1 unnamed protein product [Penicillium salamii]CAG8253431.1 unnamed protein product [Penicillium salamii]CAG8301248.1 unnamed protein product [Penicillium salamii]